MHLARSIILIFMGLAFFSFPGLIVAQEVEHEAASWSQVGLLIGDKEGRWSLEPVLHLRLRDNFQEWDLYYGALYFHYKIPKPRITLSPGLYLGHLNGIGDFHMSQLFVNHILKPGKFKPLVRAGLDRWEYMNYEEGAREREVNWRVRALTGFIWNLTEHLDLIVSEEIFIYSAQDFFNENRFRTGFHRLFWNRLSVNLYYQNRLRTYGAAEADWQMAHTAYISLRYRIQSPLFPALKITNK